MLAKKYQALPDIPVYLVSNFSYALFSFRWYSTESSKIHRAPVKGQAQRYAVGQPLTGQNFNYARAKGGFREERSSLLKLPLITTKFLSKSASLRGKGVLIDKKSDVIFVKMCVASGKSDVAREKRATSPDVGSASHGREATSLLTSKVTSL